MAKNTKGFKLEGGNWNSLNKLLNESPELERMTDDAARSILESAQNEMASMEGSFADFNYFGAEIYDAPPTPEVGIKMKMVSIPSIGFEMRFNVLKKGLDGLSN